MPHKYKTKEFPVERVREQFDYDYETGFLISKRYAGRPVKGRLSQNKGAWMVTLYREDGSRVTTNYGRAVFAWVNERWPDETIDHIDRNPRNNRVENLREADNVLQQQNTCNYSYGSCWNKDAKKWQSRIFINGKSNHLGYFKTQKAAQDAYMAECDRIGRKYLPPYLFVDRYVPAERVMGIR
jgi:hypothetical protein